MKRGFTSEPILRLPNFDFAFKVHTGFSHYAIHGVLVYSEYVVAFKRKIKSYGAKLFFVWNEDGDNTPLASNLEDIST